MSLVIGLFGGFRVVVNDVPVSEDRWVRKKSKTLLKVLALQPLHQGARQMHREELIELLWPGVKPEQGLNNLHKTLHAARRAIEPDLRAGVSSRFIQMRDQLVTLEGPDEIAVDVAAFELLADKALKLPCRGDLEAALSIYQAELLPEDLYEDWTAVRREQLRSQKEQLLLRLAMLCEESGDAPQAIEAYKRLIAANPCNEAAHRSLIRLHASIGQRHLAVEQFRACTEVLRRELEVEPEPATVKLYERILAGAGDHEPGPVVNLPARYRNRCRVPLRFRIAAGSRRSSSGMFQPQPSSCCCCWARWQPIAPWDSPRPSSLSLSCRSPSPPVRLNLTTWPTASRKV